MIYEIAGKIFAEDFTSLKIPKSTVKFGEIWSALRENLTQEASLNKEDSFSWNPTYRIGPEIVKFRCKKFVGAFDFKDGGMEICSKDNFSTIYANTCVFKGKWQYEVVLGTKGVMQIGWATLNCEFSRENGVGDTLHSYAYDGNRQRKWHVATEKYGEVWNVGDVISTTIDLDKGEIIYFRNGRCLGTAFRSVQTGYRMAYFPAMSLAIDQNLLANFGERPFLFPQPGFQPLQKPPSELVFIARKVYSWLQLLVDHTTNHSENEQRMGGRSSDTSPKVSLLIIAKFICQYLAALCRNLFVLETVLFPALVSMATSDVNLRSKGDDIERTHCFLRYFTAVLEEDVAKRFYDNLIMCIQRCYSRISLTVDYTYQKGCLKALYAMFSEPTTRKFCLRNILFERYNHYRFITFATVQCFDLVNFKEYFDQEYWCTKDGQFEQGDRETFNCTLTSIRKVTEELMELQVSVLRVFFITDDSETYSDSSRSLFISKFRRFIKERLWGSRLSSTSFVPSSTILWFCRICFTLFRRLWREEIEVDLGCSTIPPSLFCDGVLDYFDCQRLGGLYSHLKKKHAAERAQVMKNEFKDFKMISYPLSYTSPCSTEQSYLEHPDIPSTSGAVLGDLLPTEIGSSKDSLQKVDVAGSSSEKMKSNIKKHSKFSLLYFLDGIALMYHHKGHKQMDKIVAVTDTYFENVEYLKGLIRKKEQYVSLTGDRTSSIVKELDRSISIMQSHLREDGSWQAWNLATTFFMQNVENNVVFLKIILGALKVTSQKGGLFCFVPEFYLEVLLKLCRDLRCQVLCNQDDEKCSPATDSSWIFYLPGGTKLSQSLAEDYEDLLKNVAEFLALHFCDSRIVYCNSKDSLIQSLAKMVCHRSGLRALESISFESRMEMVKNLLQPYENRAWAQNNWILVRFWKGNGFAFRFSKSPHLDSKLGPKPAHCEIPNIILSSAPLVSESFLGLVSLCLEKKEISTPFVNSLLNQLNWAFSEFIGMLQEIQNASNRLERVFIDSRQLRICATCFDLALGLLRVLEMVVGRAPRVFLDPNCSDSKPLLTRLCQLLCQVLNRININSGCFYHVVKLEIPGLETIHYFPILTAVIGIICELLKNDLNTFEGAPVRNFASQFLLREASFQISSLYDVLGGKDYLCGPNYPTSSDAISAASCNHNSSASEKLVDEFSLSSSDVLRGKSKILHQNFCFKDYPFDISEGEIQKLVNVIRHLESIMSQSKADQQSTILVEDSETVCIICYANVSDATFVPCGHTSCSTCISHYLMNRCACFFCKSPIKEVKDSNGHIIYSKENSN